MAGVSIEELDKHVRDFYEGRGGEVGVQKLEVLFNRLCF